jgi:hypothetical protein
VKENEKMKNTLVSSQYVTQLVSQFDPYDSPYEERFKKISLNDEAEIKALIREFSKPLYQNFGEKSKVKAKNSLRCLLLKKKWTFASFFYNEYLPFADAEGEKSLERFFHLLWNELFDNEPIVENVEEEFEEDRNVYFWL